MLLQRRCASEWLHPQRARCRCCYGACCCRCCATVTTTRVCALTRPSRSIAVPRAAAHRGWPLPPPSSSQRLRAPADAPWRGELAHEHRVARVRQQLRARHKSRARCAAERVGESTTRPRPPPSAQDFYHEGAPPHRAARPEGAPRRRGLCPSEVEPPLSRARLPPQRAPHNDALGGCGSSTGVGVDSRRGLAADREKINRLLAVCGCASLRARLHARRGRAPPA